MKRITIGFAVILMLAGICLQAQQPPVEQDKFQAAEKARGELWKAGKYRQAVTVLLSVYNDGEFLNLPADQRANFLYNLACGYSLLNDKAGAVAFLDRALAAGYRDYYNLSVDPDFKNVRKDKDFQRLVAKVRSVGDYGQILKDHAAYKAQPELALPDFTYQAATESELRELRKTYRLDEAAGTGDDVSRIINLMRWVHKTIRHDGGSTNPQPRNALNVLEVTSGNKRGVNCRMLATVLNEVYLSMGFKSRHITCLPKYKDDPDCHVINVVYAPSVGKWLYMDPSFEAYFKNEKGEMLSIAEVREAIIGNKKLVLDKEINWNGQAASEFGYESKPTTLRVYLEPADMPPAKNTATEIHTTDVERFWSLPGKAD